MADQYTIVQHSGYGYNQDYQFALAVESRGIRTKVEADRVKAAGGELFNSYGEAEDFCEAANYPPGIQGMIPQVRGGFSAKEIDGLRIYVPVRTVVG